LEGDGSTPAIVELYDKSNEPSIKRVLIETLGRISEIEPLTKIALLDRSTEYRHLALVQIKHLKETSDSGDIKAWDVSSLQDQLNKRKSQPSPQNEYFCFCNSPRICVSTSKYRHAAGAFGS